MNSGSTAGSTAGAAARPALSATSGAPGTACSQPDPRRWNRVRAVMSGAALLGRAVVELLAHLADDGRELAWPTLRVGTGATTALGVARAPVDHPLRAMRHALWTSTMNGASVDARPPRGIDTGHRHRRRGAEAVDTKLEVVVVPVADVDRARNFYKALGWREDADYA